MHFRFAHWSDSHGNVQGANAANSIIDGIPDLDVSLYTGDCVRDLYGESISYANLGKNLFTIGNHDVMSYYGPNGNNTTDNVVSASTAYEAYIQPYASQWGITVKNGEPWWYKEYPEKKICVVSIDEHIRSSEIQQETSWINGTFQMCIEKGYTVIICAHEVEPFSNSAIDSIFTVPSYYITKVTSYWPDETLRSNWPFVFNTQSLIDSWYLKGLNILCVLCGHEHADGLFIRDTYPIVAIGSTIVDKYNNVGRSNDGHTNDACVNLYDYDNASNTLIMYRLGAGAFEGTARKMLVFDRNIGNVGNEIGTIK